MLSSLLVSALLSLAPGDVAPDFSAPNQDGKSVRLSELKGKPVLIFFYPKDDSPGCTKEVCALRDAYGDLQKDGVVVLGISRQDETSHQAFRSKHKLPYDLLVDKDGKIGEAFGVGQVPMVGWLKRESVLIDASGKIARIYRSVDPEKHPAEVIKDVAGLRATPK